MVATPRGFTLIELVVTVAIVGVLALGAVPLAELAARRAKEQDLRAALREIRTALDRYKQAVDEGRIARRADESGYPPSLEILAEGVLDAKDPQRRQRIYFLRRVPRDPFFPDATVPAARTWGLRSYASPHDAPAPGSDVFDVYSLAPGAGLNGVPYREW
jgi:general secretion pathway protein G